MFTCPQCSRIFAGVIEITKHLKYFHTFGHFKFPRLVCPSISCSVDISTWSGFLRHIKSHGEVIDNNFINSLEDHENNIAQPVLLNPSIDLENLEIPENISVDLGTKILTDLLGKFCSRLLSTGVNHSTVDLVMIELEYCISELLNLIIKMSSQLMILKNFHARSGFCCRHFTT